MSKYSKFYSNYILSKKVQNAKGGSILLRDWTTLGETSRMESGKSVIYNDGNFLFSNNNARYKYKLYGKTDFESFTYNDVKDAIAQHNSKLQLNNSSNDIRDFAYYGSAVELIRTSIEHIIETFPGQITTSISPMGYYAHFNEDIELSVEDKYIKNVPFTKFDNNGNVVSNKYVSEYSQEYVVQNPFQINLFDNNVTEDDVQDKTKYMFLSYTDYTINGEQIKRYDILKEFDAVYCQAIFDEYGDNPTFIEDNHLLTSGRFNCIYNQMRIYQINIHDVNGRLYKLNGYMFNGKVVFTCKDAIVIRPKQLIIDNYFNSLEGFEQVLLNRNSNPLYTNIFITPIETDRGIVYSNRTYTFPSNDYCIDITSASYEMFINSIYNLGQKLDDIWTDNLYQRMTHESIRNYDWTYTRDYENEKSESYREGGERIENVLHIFGLLFDRIKRYIDGIKFTNIVTYDNYNNLPLYHLTDNIQNNGFETQVVFNDKQCVYLNDYIAENNLKWFGGWQSNTYNSDNANSNFLKRLLLSCRYINKSKGTRDSIDMILGLFGLGEEDYNIQETYYRVLGKPYDKYYDVFSKVQDKKNLIRYNYDAYDGVPLNDVVINDQRFIVPYYDSDKFYDNIDFYFQGKGGWCSMENGEFIETSPYMNVVADFDSLLYLPPIQLSVFDVYYVLDLSKYTILENQKFVSNYFCLIDKYNPSVSQSWVNIDISNDEWGTDNPLYPYMTEDEYREIVNKVNHLSSIVVNNKGNNPHIGFGAYDNGQAYFDEMFQPFKYAIDTRQLDLADENITYWTIEKPINKKDEKSKLYDFEHYKALGFFAKLNKTATNWNNNNDFYKNDIIVYNKKRYMCIADYKGLNSCFAQVLPYNSFNSYNAGDYAYDIDIDKNIIWYKFTEDYIADKDNIDEKCIQLENAAVTEWDENASYSKIDDNNPSFVTYDGIYYYCKEEYTAFKECFSEMSLWNVSEGYKIGDVIYYDDYMFYGTKDNTDSKVFNDTMPKNNEYRINSKEFKLIFNSKYNTQNFRQFFENIILPYLTQVIPSTSIFKFAFQSI